jgi:hypothetical protein
LRSDRGLHVRLRARLDCHAGLARGCRVAYLRSGPEAADLLNDAVVKAPLLDADGRFSDYLPIAELAPRTGYIIRLGP